MMLSKECIHQLFYNSAPPNQILELKLSSFITVIDFDFNTIDFAACPKTVWKEMPPVLTSLKICCLPKWNCDTKIFQSALFALLEIVQFSYMQACDDYHILCYYLSSPQIHLTYPFPTVFHLVSIETLSQAKLDILQDKFVEGPWNIRKSRKPCCPITGIWFWYSTDYSSPG